MPIWRHDLLRSSTLDLSASQSQSYACEVCVLDAVAPDYNLFAYHDLDRFLLFSLR